MEPTHSPSRSQTPAPTDAPKRARIRLPITRLEAAAMGAAGVLVLLGFLGLAVVETGAFNVAASLPHSYLVAWATHTTMIHSAKLRARGIVAPERFTAADVRAGLTLYKTDCAMCHGGPSVARAAMTRGMNPTPPYLLDASSKWSPSELYWIIRNGVKLTGMPAWRDIHSEREIWSIVAFLQALPRMAPETYRETTARPPDSSLDGTGRSHPPATADQPTTN
jgi:mono/diheme cytochrome c family protein